MKKYTKFIISAIVFIVFTAIAILISKYILLLPLSEVANEGCTGFSGYQLANCFAFYERQGNADTLQRYAQIELCVLWIGLFISGVCSFFVFPRISLPRTLKMSILFLGLLSAILLAGFPFVVFTELIINGFFFAVAFVVGFFSLELVLVSSSEEKPVS